MAMSTNGRTGKQRERGLFFSLVSREGGVKEKSGPALAVQWAKYNNPANAPAKPMAEMTNIQPARLN